MKISEMTADMVRACSAKCPIGGKGAKVVAADSGDWFCAPSHREEVRKFAKLARKDLFQRRLRGGSYDGDVGHVIIGGKKFSLYPTSGMLVRDDFSLWAEKHFDECWDSKLNRERLPYERQGEDIEIREDLKIWKDIRKIALDLHEPTGLLHEGSYNSMHDMKSCLMEYATEIRRDEKDGRFYIGTKILADQLAALIAYREKNYSDAMKFYLECAASALKAALWVQKKHGRNEGSDGDAG